MAQLFAEPFYTALDANGNPISGAKLYFYATGTTTPQNVYTTSALSVAHANPVVANSSGRFAAIYLDPDLTYRVDLKDAGDVAIGAPIDPVNDGLAGLLADFSHDVAYPAGTVGAHISTPLNVKSEPFGAVGDNTADDSDAIEDWLTRLATDGGHGVMPPGEYKVTRRIAVTAADGVSISITAYGATINATSIGDGATSGCFEISGQRTTSTTLSASPVKGAKTFGVSSATGITKGKCMLVSSSDLWNPARAEYLKGEIVLVDGVSGTTVTPANPLFDGYTQATTTVHLLDMPTVSIEGINIQCNAENIGLSLQYVKNPVVRNCEVSGARYAGIYVGYVLGGQIDGNFIRDIWDGTTGTSYGVSVGSGQATKVAHNTIYGCRHAVTLGGFEPTRQAIVTDNVCYNSLSETLVGSIDAHGNSEKTLIVNNIASSVQIAGIDAIVRDNILENPTNDIPGVLVFQEINSNYYVIEGNRLVCTGTGAFGIWVSPTRTSITINSLRIANNDVQALSNAVMIQPRTSGATGCLISNITLIGNDIETLGNAPGLAIDDNGAASYAISRIKSTANNYRSSGTSAFSVLTGNPSITTSTADLFTCAVGGGSLATFNGVDVSLVAPRFEGPIAPTANARSVLFTNTGRVSVVNPYYSDLDYKAELEAAGPVAYLESGWHLATPTILNTAVAKIISSYGATGRALTYGTAAPAAGAWVVGDRVQNETPVVGQPKGWVCTVAGTPGTWVSEGNL